MDITGPLNSGIIEPLPQEDCELPIDFADHFKAADPVGQGEPFRAYLADLALIQERRGKLSRLIH